MPYELLPSGDESLLLFNINGETVKRYGTIGYMRANFGMTGREFWSTWLDCQPNLNTASFKAEYEDVINSLRNDGQYPPFANRNALAALCKANPRKEVYARGYGYKVRTLDYSYYFRCRPLPGNYDVYGFAYDNRWLLPELGKCRAS